MRFYRMNRANRSICRSETVLQPLANEVGDHVRDYGRDKQPEHGKPSFPLRLEQSPPDIIPENSRTVAVRKLFQKIFSKTLKFFLKRSIKNLKVGKQKIQMKKVSLKKI